MVDILHRVGVVAAPEAVYDALTTVEGLSAWWTEDTKGSAGLGGTIEFRFPPVGGFDMEVIEADRSKRVIWCVVDGPEEWVGTTIEWELSQAGEYTIVLFSHRGWRVPVEFMNHCSTKWALFLMSLKSLLESGEGQPAPRDVQISDWH